MKETNIDWVKNQSQTIDLLRFPMAICVIFIHLTPSTTSLINYGYSLFSDQGIYNLSGIIFSHVLSRIAVPMFFFISGYLFFANFPQWSWSKYKDKLQSRVYTLLIPYILWNFLPILFCIIRDLISQCSWQQGLMHLQQYSFLSFIINSVDAETNIFRWPSYSSYPLNFPLWFLRDLIIVCILTPLIYYFIKKTKIGILIVFAIGYLLNISIPIPGFSFISLFFFSTGAYFAIAKKNFVLFSRNHSKFMTVATLFCFIICAIFGGYNDAIGKNLCYFYIIFAIFTTFTITSYIIEKYNFKPIKLLAQSSFFIYASHTITILIWETPLSVSHKLMERHIIGYDTYTQKCISDFLVPFFTAAICFVCYYLLKQFAPKLTAVLTGNR